MTLVGVLNSNVMEQKEPKQVKAKQEVQVFEAGNYYQIVSNGKSKHMPKGSEFEVTAEMAEILVNVKKVAEVKK